VLALATSGTNLYAGGNFVHAGGISVNHVARWNGTGWAALGAGMSAAVRSLTASSTNIYAGGDFVTVYPSTSASHIAQWNGSNWSPVGSGMNAAVDALSVSGNVLYAGGAFTTAGLKVSSYAAAAILTWPEFQGKPLLNTDGSLTLNMTSLAQSTNRLYATTNLNSPADWQPIYTNLTGGLWQFTDTNTAASERKFYRLSTP
jgi:hypothetical protein